MERPTKLLVRAGCVYESMRGMRRVITRVQDGVVYFTNIGRWPGRPVRGSHLSKKSFLDWAYRRVV